MNHHLSHKQFAQGFVGEFTIAERQHINDCAGCSAELERFGSMLSSFRSAIRDRIDASSGARVAIAPPRSQGTNWRLALGAAAVVFLGIFPFLASERLSRDAAKDASDVTNPNALMDAINLHLARPVPAPMEPMFFLMPHDISKVESGGVQ